MVHMHLTCWRRRFTSAAGRFSRLVDGKDEHQRLSSLSEDEPGAGYQCLVGRSFTVDDETYVVGMLLAGAGQTLVEAHRERNRTETMRFRLSEVLDRLLVDEEIELFHPSYLGR
jgi:hypothetical protein